MGWALENSFFSDKVSELLSLRSSFDYLKRDEDILCQLMGIGKLEEV